MPTVDRRARTSRHPSRLARKKSKVAQTLHLLLENSGIEKVEHIDVSTVHVKPCFLIPHHIGKYLVFVRFDNVFQWINSRGEANEFFAGVNVFDQAICILGSSSSYIMPQTFQAEFEVGIFCPVAILLAKV